MRIIVATAAFACAISGVLFGGESESAPPQDAYGRGFVPPPFELHRVSTRAMPRMASALPTRFDWREQGKVTPVKQQGSCGACYAFAGIADIESKMLMAGEGAFDFSENNVKECEWFGRSGLYPSKCDGGTYWRIINHLVEKGTVLEPCDPYVPYNATCRKTCPYIKTVLNWRVFSLNETPAPETIKTYLLEFGPIFVAIDGGIGAAWEHELNAYDGSYTLFHPNSVSVNHAVLIVGWDDELNHAGGQGGWICKNSWGGSWGGTCGFGTERGYFTIAYGSANIGWYASFLKDWKDYDPCDQLLFYDEAGYFKAAGYSNRTAWGMCKFVADEQMVLERVEFWTTDATQDVDVYVYDGFNGSDLSGELARELDNSFTEMGYHSIELTSPVAFSAGDDFYVAVKLRNVGYIYPLSYDDVGPEAPGMCYWGPTDASWSEFPHGDLGIRVRVHLDRDCEPPDGVSSFSATAMDSRVELEWTNPTNSDFDHVMVRYSTAAYPGTQYDGKPVENGSGGLFYNDPGTTDGFSHTGLESDLTYYYSAFSGDTIPNYSTAARAAATPGDTMPPDPVADFEGSPNDRLVELTWTNPDDSDLDGVLITYSTEGPPGSPAGGSPVENGNDGIFDAAPGTLGSFTHEGLYNDTTYHYCIWAFDLSQNYSSSQCIQAVPVDLAPPEFSISVLQNPYISNHLDVYVIPSEPVIETSFVVTIDGEEVEMESVPGDAPVLRCDYEVYESGELEIEACADDLRHNHGCTPESFGVSQLLAGSGGSARSTDGRMELAVPRGVLERDAYIIISEALDESCELISAYHVSPASLILDGGVTVSIAFERGAVEPEHLAIARVEDGGIHPLESYFDCDSGRIVAFTDRLGTFGLLERPDLQTPDYEGEDLKLLQNVPNPFAGSTRIGFSVPRPGHVRAEVVSVEGRRVRPRQTHRRMGRHQRPGKKGRRRHLLLQSDHRNRDRHPQNGHPPVGLA
jgi:C1A family cysteine protease